MPTERQLETPVQPDVSRMPVRQLAAPRNVLFAGIVAASAIAFLTPLRNWVALSMGSDEYSYLVLIPAMVLGLLWLERIRIFRDVRYSPGAGTFLLLAGFATAAAGDLFSRSLGGETRLAVEFVGLNVVWIGGFVLCYGTKTARAGTFALLFSFLLVPLPHSLMDQPIALVQHGSADVTNFLFNVFGLPVFRNGLTFSLPRLNFIVAQECSGIHSTIALFIAAVIASHFYLKAGWKTLLLVLLVLPIVCFTNGLRMFILATLAVYVNPAFFHGNLHHKGGAVFFVLALVILFFIAKLLRRLSPVQGTVKPFPGESPAA